MIIDLGAYQTLEITPKDLGEQYTEGGTRPLTVVIKLTTAMDEGFVNRSVTALLSEEAQEKIIKALNENIRYYPKPKPMKARIRYWTGGELPGWYINYSQDGQRWGRNHYGPLLSLLRAWWRVRTGREPQKPYQPYGEHL